MSMKGDGVTMTDKEIFYDIEKHLLNDSKPSVYLSECLKKGAFDKYPFSMIKDLQTVDQNPKFHPEGNVFIHTMMVVDEGAKVRDKSHDKRALMWGLLLHDLGKKPTTKWRKGRLTSYDHDKVGFTMAHEFLEYFDENEEFIDKVSSLVRWHMQSLFVTKSLQFQDIEGMLKDVDPDEIVLVATADRLGRGNLNKNDVQQTMKDIDKFREVIQDKIKK